MTRLLWKSSCQLTMLWKVTILRLWLFLKEVMWASLLAMIETHRFWTQSFQISLKLWWRIKLFCNLNIFAIKYHCELIWLKFFLCVLSLKMLIIHCYWFTQWRRQSVCVKCWKFLLIVLWNQWLNESAHSE